MSIKIIAIGNRLMGDDGSAIHIAEKLSKSFEDNGVASSLIWRQLFIYPGG